MLKMTEGMSTVITLIAFRQVIFFVFEANGRDPSEEVECLPDIATFPITRQWVHLKWEVHQHVCCTEHDPKLSNQRTPVT